MNNIIYKEMMLSNLLKIVSKEGLYETKKNTT